MSKSNITDTLANIEVQLGTLTRTVADLRALFEQAGLSPKTTSLTGRLKLHEAMAVVLRQRGNAWTKISDVAEMINTQGLYMKANKSPVEPNQLHARANRPTYQPMFEKQGPMIRLRVD